MTETSLAYHRAAIAALEKLADKMCDSQDFSEVWAAKAYYLLSDMRVWLNEQEEKGRGD